MEETRTVPWTRVQEGRLLAGVCAGFARRHGVSPWVVRVFTVLGMVITAGLGVLAYVVLAVILPADPPRSPRGA